MMTTQLTMPNQADADKSQTGGDSAEAIGKEDVQSGQDDNDLGVKDVPVELKDKEKELVRAFHEKTQALSEKEKKLLSENETYRRDANDLYKLAQEEWFRQAVEGEKQRRSGALAHVSDEEFEAIKNDKKAFSEFLSKRDKTITDQLRSEFNGKFEHLSAAQQETVTEREFALTEKEYGSDFKDAAKSGALDPYLDKDYSYEDAYILHKQKLGEVARKDKGPSVTDKKSATIEKTGISNARGGPVVKAKNLNDALTRTMNLIREGKKDFRVEKE